jgi:predicted aspartyl protease
LFAVPRNGRAAALVGAGCDNVLAHDAPLKEKMMSDIGPPKRIPVQYVDRPGQKGKLPREKSPVIEVGIGHNDNFRRVRALIDTGADDIVVDERLLEVTGCPKTQQTARVSTQHDARDHAVHEATIIIEVVGAQARFTAPVVSTKIDQSSKAYAAVFGTSFLELGRLVLDPNGERTLPFAMTPSSDPLWTTRPSRNRSSARWGQLLRSLDARPLCKPRFINNDVPF